MPKNTATAKRKRAAKKAKPPEPAAPLVCEVSGCGAELPAGTMPLETPIGKAWLCTRCAELARVNLRQAELRQDALDIAAAPYERAAARQRTRQAETVQRQFGGAVLLG